jgi:uncharacterized protein
MEESEELIGYARRENEEFRRLEREHRELDEQIRLHFGNVKHLTPVEEFEKKTLQKQKLAKKDRMFEILHDLRAVV